MSYIFKLKYIFRKYIFEYMFKYTAILMLCLLPGLIGCAGGKVIHVNETGWWVAKSQFHRSATPLNDALKNASAGDTIVVYRNGNLSGTFVHISRSILNSIQPQTTQVLIKNWLHVFLGVLLPVSVAFGLILYAGYRSNRNLNRTEMRRAMAGAFIVGIHCLLVLSVVFDVARDVVIGSYIGGLSSVIGFYFGSRTAQQTHGEGEEGAVRIENVDFRDCKGRQIVISFRNGSSRSVEVDAVYINNKPQRIEKVKVNPKSAGEIVLDYEWEAGKDYSIKVCTSDGFCSEINRRAPERGGEM